MKKLIILALAVVSFESAFADVREPGRIGPRGPGPGPSGPGPGPREPGRDRDDLPMCLKNLNNANSRITELQSQLLECSRSRNPYEVEELRRENQRLNELTTRLQYDNNRLLNDNNRLYSDNMELRRQLDDLQNDRNGRTLGFFSYAGCKDFNGKIDLKYIISAEGRVALEAETNAVQKMPSNYSCTYGIVVGKTEEIRFSEARSYCVAGCKDFNGNVDTKYIRSATGRNLTEAEYGALKAVAKDFSCTYGIKIQACQ